MNRLRMALVFAALFVAAASTRSFGQIIISGTNSPNCVSNTNYTGFSALSWTIGGADPVTTIGGIGEVSRPALADLTLTRNVDVCSETLIKNFLVGQQFPTLVLSQYETRGSGQSYAYMVVTLTNAVVNSYMVGGSNSTDPAETVSFGYSKLCVQTTGQNPDGSLKAPVSVCYNLGTNQLQ